MAVDAESYLASVRTVIDRVARDQLDGVRRAAELIAASIQAGGVLQCFGTGHSEAVTMEFAGRAGGLIATNRIALRDLVLYGDAPREVLYRGLLERDPTVARRLYHIHAPTVNDVFMVASNSGINGAIVEFALVVKEYGHPLIVMTSTRHTTRAAPRHPSGRRLSELADVVLDNGAPYGDALLDLPDGGSVGAVSSITSALLAQLVTVEVVAAMLRAGQVPAVYLSANVPGGDDHNLALESRYAGRIRRSA